MINELKHNQPRFYYVGKNEAVERIWNSESKLCLNPDTLTLSFNRTSGSIRQVIKTLTEPQSLVSKMGIFLTSQNFTRIGVCHTNRIQEIHVPFLIVLIPYFNFQMYLCPQDPTNILTVELKKKKQLGTIKGTKK